jgi:hypothetical protein
MTIYCKNCGKAPFNYIEIDRRYLCMNCASNQYQKELKELNDKFIGVDIENLTVKYS